MTGATLRVVLRAFERRNRRRALAVVAVVAIAVAACVGVRLTRAAGVATAAILDPSGVRVPRPDHVLIVIEENHAYGEVVGAPTAPYITSLAREGANFTASFAETHPSQPNYIALFSGSPHGVTDDRCPVSLSGASLGRQLLDAGLTFSGFSESMPVPGFTGTEAGPYKSRHNPWVDFDNLPASVNLRLTDLPRQPDRLPAVCFVIPNIENDMHGGSVETADAWLRLHIAPYIDWLKTHNGLFVLTFDEDDGSAGNRIPTIFVGPMVLPGNYDRRIDHYCLLRTIEAMYGLAAIGNARDARTIGEVWARPDERSAQRTCPR
jgi:acid phosphatase